MPFGYAAVAAGTIGAGLIGADATKSATSQQVGQEEQALALQKQLLGQTTGNVQPYVSSGQNALQSINQLLGLNPGGNPVTANPILQMLGIGGPGPTGGINPATFTGSPGYQYQLQQGQNAVTNAATRGPGGGNALMALQANGQQLANQNWGQYLSELSPAWQQLLSNVGGQAQQGLNAAGVLSGAGQSNVNAQSGILGGIGNSQAAGTIGQASILGSGLNNLLGLGGTAALTSGTTPIAAYNALFNGGGPFSANTLNTTFGTQFGPGTFPSAANPNAIVPGYAPDNFTPLSS